MVRFAVALVLIAELFGTLCTPVERALTEDIQASPAPPSDASARCQLTNKIDARPDNVIRPSRNRERTCCMDMACGYYNHQCSAKDDTSSASDSCRRERQTVNLSPAVPVADAALITNHGFLPVGNQESGTGAFTTPEQLAEARPYPGVDFLGFGCTTLAVEPASAPILPAPLLPTRLPSACTDMAPACSPPPRRRPYSWQSPWRREVHARSWISSARTLDTVQCQLDDSRQPLPDACELLLSASALLYPV